jgi:hypothetical protein
MTRFWRTGFWSVLAACVVASCLAYAGVMRLAVPGVPHVDFVGHLVFMALLSFFADGLLGHRAVLGPVRWGPLLVLLAAATDEVLQRYSANRSSTWSDFVADLIGVTLTTLLASRITHALTARRARCRAA